MTPSFPPRLSSDLVAYVVRDIEAATQRFAREFGIARWDIMDMAALLGPGHGTRFIGNAYAGEVMIELIEPDPTGESLYRDWIPDAADGVRLHLPGLLLRRTSAFRRAVAPLEEAGSTSAHTGRH